MLRKLTILLLTTFFANHVSAETIDREQAAGLMAECRNLRQEKIAPLKAQAIDDCVTKEQKDAEYCERYYRDYGEKTTGGARQGMFWDLPQCRKAIEADKYFKMYPSAKEFEFD